MEKNIIQQNFSPPSNSPFKLVTQETFNLVSNSTDLKDFKSHKPRGRKKLRPGNPLKTEVLDKYWLRSFKNFVKSEYLPMKTFLKDSEFWKWYLLKGKPAKNSVFLSYNSNYKKTLFENQEFCGLFVAWGITIGSLKVTTKCLKAPWEFYYEYLYQDLIPRSFNMANHEEIKTYHEYICGKIMGKIAKNILYELAV